MVTSCQNVLHLRYTERLSFCIMQVRSGHFITDSQSVSPSWPLAHNCDSWLYFSLKKISVLSFVVRQT
jgi:hypothetical protein